MPSYRILTVLSLAAPIILPALSAPVQVTRERALVYPELVIGKRVFEPKIRPSEVKPESGAADIKPETGVADIPKKTWGSRLKSLALDTVIGGGAALIGTDIYSHMNPDSAALGDSSPPAESTGATSDTTAFPTASQGYNTPNYSTTNPGSSTTGPNYATTNPGSSTNGPTTNPGSSTTGPNYATTNSGSPASTGPGSSTTGSSPTTTYYPGTDPGSTPYPYYNPPSTRAIAERAREERTLDHKHKLSLGISTRTNSNMNSRASPYTNLLSRAELERAITLVSRMLDELD